ncbi:hypothetical protein H9L39_03154 [Fusarium oxysporum f. sp. albedinis]|nr:hypothetical protein H9L39_03154 [Fusarium oxysporum f. sp. albedinis]
MNGCGEWALGKWSAPSWRGRPNIGIGGGIRCRHNWTNWTLAALAGEPPTFSVGNGPERRSRQPPGPWGFDAFS